jgi:hypothetical protein
VGNGQQFGQKIKPKNQWKDKIMKELDMYNSRVWVKLSKRGLAHLTNYCAGFADCGTNIPGELMSVHQKKDGWFEFSLVYISLIFHSILKDGHEVPFEGNKIFLECPFTK